MADIYTIQVKISAIFFCLKLIDIFVYVCLAICFCITYLLPLLLRLSQSVALLYLYLLISYKSVSTFSLSSIIYKSLILVFSLIETSFSRHNLYCA